MIISDEIYKSLGEDVYYVTLDISSFTFCGAIGAEHYYGKLHFKNTKDEETTSFKLKRDINLREAQYLDKKEKSDGMRVANWHEGDKEALQFNNERSVMIEAIEVCKQISEKIHLGFGLRIQIH